MLNRYDIRQLTTICKKWEVASVKSDNYMAELAIWIKDYRKRVEMIDRKGILKVMQECRPNTKPTSLGPVLSVLLKLTEDEHQDIYDRWVAGAIVYSTAKAEMYAKERGTSTTKERQIQYARRLVKLCYADKMSLMQIIFLIKDIYAEIANSNRKVA